MENGLICNRERETKTRADCTESWYIFITINFYYCRIIFIQSKIRAGRINKFFVIYIYIIITEPNVYNKIIVFNFILCIESHKHWFFSFQEFITAGVFISKSIISVVIDTSCINDLFCSKLFILW